MFSLSTSKVLQILKFFSAKLFFENKEKARLRYPRGHLWSRGKFASSVGYVQLEVAKEYVRSQDEHHGNSTLKCGEDVINKLKNFLNVQNIC